eukprot:3260849-Pleurochrysis_carterae.AAC.1
MNELGKGLGRGGRGAADCVLAGVEAISCDARTCVESGSSGAERKTALQSDAGRVAGFFLSAHVAKNASVAKSASSEEHSSHL